MTRTLVLMLALLGSAPAFGHAFLDHAEPRVGSSVEAPRSLTLTFTEPVEPAFSRVQVLDHDGHPVSTGPPEHPEPAQLRVSLPPLPPGQYRVRWAVVSVDTHPTEGHFTFTVERP